MHHKSFMRTSVFCIAVLASAGVAHAWTFKTLYSFCKVRGCTDGKAPMGGVILDGSGNLYGTTSGGGAKGGGVLFKLTRNPVTGLYTYSRTYSFCSLLLCGDGRKPWGDLIIDVAGNLYGTTFGSQTNCGTVFEFTAGGTLTVLHAFTCSDGEWPIGLSYVGAGAPYDGHSSLFGATYIGGAHVQSAGVVYQLTPGNPAWTLDILHDFCAETNCADGQSPWERLLVDSNSRLYGTTTLGGAHHRGTVYRLDLVRRIWQETVLHSFCTEQSCDDGFGPLGGVNKDKSGVLFGTTEFGGAHSRGAAYRLANDGSSFQVTYGFCTLQDCLDGAYPAGDQRRKGSALFGVTSGGGETAGNVFQLRPDNGTWTATSLHNFQTDCSDGCHPQYQQLAMDADGNLFGTTESGGLYGGGTVFELSP
jgi:uncharacterized repeat protein (TIGR03803 family)